MPKELTLLKADDTNAGETTDFGDVDVGTTTAPINYKLTNTGDVTISSVRLYIQQTSTDDGALIGSVSGTPLTDTPVEFAETLEPGDFIPITLQWTVPPDAIPTASDSAGLMWKYR